jgi:hypothetical protein
MLGVGLLHFLSVLRTERTNPSRIRMVEFRLKAAASAEGKSPDIEFQSSLGMKGGTNRWESNIRRPSINECRRRK